MHRASRSLVVLLGLTLVLAALLAYEAQRVPNLPRTVTDARLDAVITEAGIHSDLLG